MTWSVRRHPHLIEDVVEHAAYIKLDNPDAAERFVLATEVLFGEIREQPLLSSKARFEHPELQDLRWRPVPSFRKHLVFFQVNEPKQEVAIYALIHGARLLEKHMLPRVRTPFSPDER